MVTLDGSAWLKKDRELGTSAYIGIVQNLVYSVRGAVYRHGGDPAGEIIAEHMSRESNKWDAVKIRGAEQTTTQPQTFAPFYWQPGNIDDSNVEGTPAKSTPARHAERPARVRHAGHLRRRAGSPPSRATTPSRWASAIKKERRSGCSPARLVGGLERPGRQGPQRRRQGGRDQGDRGPAQGRAGRQPDGLERWTRARGRRSRASRRRPAHEALAGGADGLAVRRPPARPDRPTRTSAARWTPRRRTSRSTINVREDRRAVPRGRGVGRGQASTAR